MKKNIGHYSSYDKFGDQAHRNTIEDILRDNKDQFKSNVIDDEALDWLFGEINAPYDKDKLIITSTPTGSNSYAHKQYGEISDEELLLLL